MCIRDRYQRRVHGTGAGVKVDGNLITASGPHQAKQFGMEICKFLAGQSGNTAVDEELEAARDMEELKARIDELKGQDPVKMQDLERKYGLLKFELLEAKKAVEQQEITLADVKGEWIKDNSEENLAIIREEEQNLKIARMNHNAAVEKMDIMKSVVFLLS
eukprot:TRINITY_DN15550_c0_g1_i2.p2 TRINITY_DN15550_c0_g1~~TRINITY_DN15550_c0_g1_i2.p2  ORF type:complete len:161 (+),score=19.55 TRINITY_DN15550_c0_g1_i2:193-675(+)